MGGDKILGMRPTIFRFVQHPFEGSLRGARLAGHDLGLLGCVVAVHMLPLVAFVAGRPIDPGLAGYAMAVVLYAGRELAHEIVSALREPSKRRFR